jgi:hypothetical protein
LIEISSKTIVGIVGYFQVGKRAENIKLALMERGCGPGRHKVAQNREN